jgi:hypothetical protein
VVRRIFAALAGAVIFLAALSPAVLAQNPPYGTRTINQVSQLRALTPNNSTVFVATKGLYIGDATACNIAVKGAQDASAVTLLNVQSGAVYPFSIKQLLSSATTCTSVFGLY